MAHWSNLAHFLFRLSKVLLEHSTPIHLCIIYGCLSPYDGSVKRLLQRPAKPTVFTIWPFTERSLHMTRSRDCAYKIKAKQFPRISTLFDRECSSRKRLLCNLLKTHP